MFDQMDEVVQDYDTRIRQARESRGVSQETLASELNEKASLIRKLERGDVLPDDSVQQKLEKKLDISLVEGGANTDKTDWSSSSASGGTTLGDVVKRKD
jgi:putative transcription factor